MPGNEFEKDIQSRLSGLKLRPSAEVWERVADDIRKKKRRRVLAFFLLFLVLLTGGYAGVQFFSGNNTDRKTPAISQTNPAPGSATGNTSQNDPVARNSNSGQSTVNDKADDQLLPENNKTTTQLTGNRNRTQTSSAAVRSGHNRQKKESVYTSGTHQIRDNSVPQGISATDALQQNNTDVTLPADGDKTTAITTDTPSQPVDNNNSLPAAVPSATVESAPALSAAQADTVTNSVQEKLPEVTADSAAKTATVKKKKSWRWGVEGGLGVAGVLSAPLSMKAASPAENVLYSGLNQQSSLLIPGTVTYLPGPANPSFAWNLGVVVEKQVSRRSSFSAGLRYSYMSTSQKTGEYNPSFRANVGEPKNNYTNSFHFISLPVSYHWVINQCKVLPPVTLDIGFTASRLLYTDALLYSPEQGGINFKDKKLFNKNHFELTTGFSVHLNPGGRWQWSVGPQAGFDLSNLYLDKAGQAREYLYYGGLRLRLLIPQR